MWGAAKVGPRMPDGDPTTIDAAPWCEEISSSSLKPWDCCVVVKGGEGKGWGEIARRSEREGHIW